MVRRRRRANWGKGGNVMRWLVLLAVACLLSGCTRAYYRRSADRETYKVIDERTGDPQWSLPSTAIDPPPESRLHDPTDPNHPPLPPDDPAAERYLYRVDGMRNYKHWDKDGLTPWIEYPEWRESLTLSPDGSLFLSTDRAIELGVLHSREYQTALESLYSAALALTLNRYEFVCRWFARNNTVYTHFGSSADESNQLRTSSNAGFTRALAAGGQLLVDFANSFVFEFTHGRHTTVTSDITVNLIQPLLRGAGREVRLAALTDAERSVLYAVRDFARFRKQFSVNIAVGGRGYLQLLLLLQSIRNQEANLKSLEQNLRLHEALLAAGEVSTVKVDQVFQSYQQGKLGLVQARAALETRLDDFKTVLGLPPSLPVKLDDSILTPFQLTDPALNALQEELDRFFAEYRELDQAPLLAKLQEAVEQQKTFHERTGKLIDLVDSELERWKGMAAESGDDPAQTDRERADQKKLARELKEVRDDQAAQSKEIDKAGAELDANKRNEGWQALLKRTRKQNALLSELFVIQTQVRVYLIKLQKVKWQLDDATPFALEHRLDLMNQRGRVVDAWRQVGVTANALKGGADVTVHADVATPPDGNNPVGFRASASTYSAGVQFDGPLDRQAERNAYRLSQIVFQRVRRAYMALDDGIQASIRLDLRSLETERLNFEIARQSLISAARQVEAARQQLLVEEKATDPTRTQDVLIALSALLQANQALISSWVNYESGRVQLLLDLEALQLNERGLFQDEYHQPPERPDVTANTPIP